MWHLTLYCKPDCPLCEEAKEEIGVFAKECDLQLKLVDISRNRALWERYQYEIPVLLIEDQIAARHHIGLKKLRVLRKRWKEGKGFPAPRASVFPIN